MEKGVVEQWEVEEEEEEEEEAEVVEKSLRGRRPREESNGLVNTSTASVSASATSSSTTATVSGTESTDFGITIPETESFPAASSLPLSKNALDEQIAHIPSSQHQNISILKGSSRQDETEFYLDGVFEKPVTHDFYCPNCNSCVKKVILRGTEWETGSVQPPEPIDPIRCTSCFSFLIPAGNWFIRNLVDSGEETRNKQAETNVPEAPPRDSLTSKAPSGGTKVHDWKVDSAPSATEKIEDDEEGGGDGFRIDIGPAAVFDVKPTDEPKRSDRGILGTGEVEHPQITQPLIPRLPEIPTDSASLGADKLEIVKSIVFGGLTASITSLSFVTSATSADAATLRIVALALANLISGLFAIGHNLWDLKNEKPEGAPNQTNEQVGRYQELLGQRKNFIIHATIAVLSYIVFGLVPPVVYGFTFMDVDKKDFKLATVAAASLLCITMLAMGKAYIQKPPKSYIKTPLHYILVGLMASGVSYVARCLIKKLIEKLGLFQSGAADRVPGRREWASY